MEISLGSVSILRVTGPTVTLQNNNEHDDTEQQQQRLRSHHDHLVRRFLHPQLPKIIIASLEECKSRIVLVFWHADDLVADMTTLYINDNTSDLAKRRRFPREKPDRDKTESTVLCCYKLSARFGHSIRPVAFVFCRIGHRTINVQWKRDCGTFGPLGRMQNE